MQGLSFTFLLACACFPAHAAPPVASVSPAHMTTVMPSENDKGCVEVEIAGRKEQSMSCLGEKMLPAASAGARRPPTLPGAEEIAQRPLNQLGLYNRAATEHRMGNAFGKSLTPQRPATPPPASPLIPSR